MERMMRNVVVYEAIEPLHLDEDCSREDVIHCGVGSYAVLEGRRCRVSSHDFYSEEEV